MTYRHLLFLLTLATLIFIPWLAGFNFDHRSPTVAVYAFISIAISVFMYTWPERDLDKKVFKQKEIK